MPVERLLPTPEAAELLELTREIARKELAPKAAQAEANATPPREVFRTLGAAGLLSLPYDEAYGGGGQPYEVYLQVLEELAAAWMSVAVGVSVHALTAFPVSTLGSEEQKQTLLPRMLSGDLLGGYCLSEREAGSDIASMRTRATEVPEGYSISGTKAWISHAAHADYYTAFVRTDDTGGKGLSCFHVPADSAGLSFGSPERKMGLDGDPVAEVHFDKVIVPASSLIGHRGQGMAAALAALDSGRLGIAASATGLAQSALDLATSYAKERKQFGRAIADNQGLAFLLADMEVATQSARAAYLYAARLKDAGRPFSRHAAVAKVVATDAAMKVTTDAVQVLGGAGYIKDFPAERYFREAKVTQIFEGTNQIQRLVISRHLLHD